MRCVTDPWDRWNEVALLDLSDVPSAHRPLYAVGWLRTEINNDGFDGLFFNLAGNVVPHATAAARSAGAADLADLVERAMSVLGDHYPLDIDQRQGLMMALSDADRGRLDALDREYYELEASTNLDELMRSLAARS
jgi:Domain of unknown function (DUF4375)